MLGLIEDDLRDAMGIDVVGVFPRKTMFGFPAEDWKEWNFRGLDVLVPGGFPHPHRAQRRPPHLSRRRRHRRRPAAACRWAAPSSTTIVRQPAIDEDASTPKTTCEEFAPVTDEDLAHIRRAVRAPARPARRCRDVRRHRVRRYRAGPRPVSQEPERHSRRHRVVHVHHAAAATTSTAFSSASARSRIENLSADPRTPSGDAVDVALRLRHGLRHADLRLLLRRHLSRALVPVLQARQRLGPRQHRLEMLQTFLRQRGAFLESFIEAGFDIINPVQCSATGMDPRRI